MTPASAARRAAKERAQEGEGTRVGQQRGELTTVPGLGMGGGVISCPSFCLYGESLMEYTGAHGNDFTTHD